MKAPGMQHPISIQPDGHHITVRAGGWLVADTRSALDLFEADHQVVRYIPLTDVDQSLLQRTDTHTHCPYKGDASYYSIVTDAGQITDAVWTYEHPVPALAPIAGHVAFYANRVEIMVGDA